MSEQPKDELSTIPGWDDLVLAGNVAPVDPQVLDRTRDAVRRAVAQDTGTGTRVRMPSRPRRPRIAIAVLAAAAISAFVVAVVPSSAPPVAVPTQVSVPTPAAHNPSQNSGTDTSCVEMYTLGNLAHRTFAFDGTVEKVVPMSEPPAARLGRVEATFAVAQWFRGGTGSHVTVIMTGSGRWPAPDLIYKIGTRLLVSGEKLSHGEPMAVPIAWTGCGGFTQPYDSTTAATWESTFSK